MSDPTTPQVKDWMKRTDAQPPDAQQSAREVMARVPEVRQRRRWWPFPVFYRNVHSPTANDATGDQPGPTPATHGLSPTLTGRTRSMLSPTTAITTGAVALAIGVAFLVAQPGGQGDVVPGAEPVTLDQPLAFTATFEGGGGIQGTPATCEQVDGVNHCRDGRPPLSSIEASDPLINGRLTVSQSQIQYPDHWFHTTTYRIFNGGGVWQGSSINGASVVLVGEGGYEGLYAWMDVSNWDEVSGVIYPTAPLEATDLDPAS